MMRSDESAVCAQRMAVAVSLFQSFVEDVVYALSQLGMRSLKRSSSELLKQYVMEMTFLSLPGFGKSIIMFSCPFFLV